MVEAAKEVILSAGPYGSPKLLQLSGIGPRDVLEEYGVEVVAELPVGEHAHVRLQLLTSVVCTVDLC